MQQEHRSAAHGLLRVAGAAKDRAGDRREWVLAHLAPCSHVDQVMQRRSPTKCPVDGATLAMTEQLGGGSTTVPSAGACGLTEVSSTRSLHGRKRRLSCPIPASHPDGMRVMAGVKQDRCASGSPPGCLTATTGVPPGTSLASGGGSGMVTVTARSGARVS